jgi:hypothetical protein
MTSGLVLSAADVVEALRREIDCREPVAAHADSLCVVNRQPPSDRQSDRPD